MKTMLSVLPLCAAVLLMVAASGQAQESAEAPASVPAAAASGNALTTAVGSFFDRFSSKPDKSAEAPPLEDATGKSGKSTQASGSFNIIDIESWSKTSNVVLDPECKIMVQPFGIADNAASLALLAGKLQLKILLQSPGSQSPDIKAVLKLAALHLNWLPMYFEVQLGQNTLTDIETLDEDKSKDVRKAYAEARSVLAEILKSLPPDLPYEFKIRLQTNGQSAQALPGGILLVGRDLFKKGFDPGYAYFIMAHEVAHVLQRHQTRSYQARLADGVDTVTGLRKLIEGSSGQLAAGALLAYGTKLKGLFVNFSEEQELQADSCALRMLVQKYPDRKHAGATLQFIAKSFGPITVSVANGPEGDGVLAQMKYLADGVMERHPNSAKRQANLHNVWSKP